MKSRIALIPLTAAAGAAAAVGIGFAAGAGSSHRAVAASPAGSAVRQPGLVRPFTAVGDENVYDLAPGGNFAPKTASWSFNGQASVVSSGVDVAASGSHALSLQSGASATSATFGGRGVHTVRFYAENLGAKSSTLQVSATVDEDGVLTQVPLGTVQGSTLAPTPIMSLPANLQAELAKSDAPLSITVRAPGHNSHWIVKNVFVDPYSRAGCC